MILSRAKRRIAATLSTCPAVLIWGAGTGGRVALDLLPRHKVRGFVDSFSELRELDGLPVSRPEILADMPPDTVVVVSSVAEREITHAYARMGHAPRMVSLAELLTESFSDAGEFDRLALDFIAAYERSWLETLLRKPQMVLNVSYRLCRWLGQASAPLRWLWWPVRFWHTFNCAFFGIDLPVTVEAGGGLQFVHPGGIVLHEATRLGRFVKIYQCVTIGSGRKGDIPTIGNHVTLWSSAVLVGGCRIGDHAQVGANSLCLRDLVVEDAIAAGSPAQVIKKN